MLSAPGNGDCGIVVSFEPNVFLLPYYYYGFVITILFVRDYDKSSICDGRKDHHPIMS